MKLAFIGFLAVAATTLPALAATPPAGSYQASCSQVTFDGTSLGAVCRNRAGQGVATSVVTVGCRRDIANIDGQLKCESDLGSFSLTCRDIVASPSGIAATCQRANGTWVPASIGAHGDQVSNCDGALQNGPVCGQPTPPPPAPPPAPSSWQFVLQTGTALHETDDTFDFLVAANRDVVAVKKAATGTKSTEIHVLSAAQGYKAFSLQTGTALHETGANFDFALAPNGDVFAIKKSATGTNSTEIHVLSAAQGYKAFSLQTGTALHETADNFDFLVAPNRDLIAIKKSATGTHSTEIHVLSAAQGYKAFSLQTGTVLHETDASFTFALAGNGDIWAIKKANTGTHSTEIHVLSAAQGYKAFSLQTGTALHETDRTFAFGVDGQDELVAVKKAYTGTHTTEVHILRRQ